MNIDIRLGDCLDVLPTIATGSIDTVITDPPYPCIKRDYGYWTEAEWWKLIVEGVIPEVRRILKPTGSAVFILQPNSEHVGQMRGWLWEFMAWVCREWNMVQDAWWWNINALPNVHTHSDIGLMRPSLKACVWVGNQNCFRNQSEILWEAADYTLADNRSGKALGYRPSGYSFREGRSRERAKQTGKSTPFNVIPLSNGQCREGHGAETPIELIDWWLRYIVPPGGVVVDPFLGSGTTAVAAIKQGKSCIGCDRVPGYIEIARRRVEEAQLQIAMPLEVVA